MNKILNPSLNNWMKYQLLKFRLYHSWHLGGFLFALVPVIGLFTGIIPFTFRFLTIAIVFLVALALTLYQIRRGRWNWRMLGFRFDNLIESTPFYILILVGGSLILSVVAWAGDYSTIVTDYPVRDLVFVPIFVSILQRFLYGSFLNAMLLEGLKLKTSVIIWGTFYFSLLHVFYSEAAILLILSAILGLAFNIVWVHYDKKNIYLAGIVHTILNAQAIYFTIFSKTGAV